MPEQMEEIDAKYDAQVQEALENTEEKIKEQNRQEAAAKRKQQEETSEAEEYKREEELLGMLDDL